MLFVRELVLGALENEHLVHQHGVWRLVGPLVTTARLHELVSARLGSLDASATEALEILAVWEPAGLSTLEAIVGRDQLELLDRAGRPRRADRRRRQHVALAHPLYGEILRARMPALTRRRLLLEHADRIDACGARRREDPVRVATARSGGIRLGRSRPARTGRPAGPLRPGLPPGRTARPRAALLDGMTTRGWPADRRGAPRARPLRRCRRDAHGRPRRRVPTTSCSCYIIEIRSRNLMWGLQRYDEALEVEPRPGTASANPAALRSSR